MMKLFKKAIKTATGDNNPQYPEYTTIPGINEEGEFIVDDEYYDESGDVNPPEKIKRDSIIAELKRTIESLHQELMDRDLNEIKNRDDIQRKATQALYEMDKRHVTEIEDFNKAIMKLNREIADKTQIIRQKDTELQRMRFYENEYNSAYQKMSERVATIRHEIINLLPDAAQNIIKIETDYAETLNFSLYIDEKLKDEFLESMRDDALRNLDDATRDELFTQSNIRWNIIHNPDTGYTNINPATLKQLVDYTDQFVKFNEVAMLFLTYSAGKWIINNYPDIASTLQVVVDNHTHNVLDRIYNLPIQIIQPSALTNKYGAIIASNNFCAGLSLNKPETINEYGENNGLIEKIDLNVQTKYRLSLLDTLRPTHDQPLRYIA